MSSRYEFDADLIEGSGNVEQGIAGEALAARKLVYPAADGYWYLADADAAATMPTIGITRWAARLGGNVEIITDGYIGDTAWAWVVPGLIYASTVAGELTQTPPSPPDFVQVVGYASKSYMVRVDPFPPSEGLGAGVTKEEFYAPSERDAYIGQHFGAQMLDGVETIVGFEFAIPNNFHTLVSAVVMVVQTTAATPDMVWSATTDFAEACTTENYNNHQDTTGSQTDQVLQSDVVCLDVSTALSGIAAGDLVGMEFLRDGDNAADTVGGPVYCLAMRLRYR